MTSDDPQSTPRLANQHISSARRRTANEILSLFSAEPALLGEFQDDLGAFCEGRGRSLSEASLRRSVRFIEDGNKNQDLVVPWIEAELPKLLDRLSVDGTTKARVEEIKRRAADETEHAVTSDVPTETPKDAHKVALQLLLGMSEGRDYRVTDLVAGEYLGYRLSANHGDIIRFYIKIDSDPATGLLRFHNRFRRGRYPWTVDGIGFNVGGVTYLLGQARSDQVERDKFGLRLFSLRKYQSFDWYNGPLISMDDEKDPIAARVVLVPAQQHRAFRDVPEPEREAKIMELIEDRVKDAEGELDGGNIDLIDRWGKSVFSGVRASVHIRALIWNLSFTTLHARQKIEPSMLDKYERLFELQRRSIPSARRAEDDMAPWMKIADRVEEMFPINNRDIDYKRSESN